jgi:hypothetical protein
MTIDDKWNYVAGTLITMRNETDKLEAAIDAVKIDHESLLVTPCDVLQDCLIDALGLLIDNCFDSLEWFIYECDYGRKPKEAGVEGNMRSIKTMEDLRWLMELQVKK